MLKRGLLVTATAVFVLLTGCAGTGSSGNATESHAGHGH